MTGGRFKQRQIYCHFFFLHFFSPIDGNFFLYFSAQKGFLDPSKVHQVLHQLQKKEKPMQNNFEAPVWLLKMVFECSIVCEI